MAFAVHKIRLHAGLCQHLPGGCVNRPGFHAYVQGPPGGGLTVEDRLVPVSNAARRSAYENCPSQVTAIVGEYSTRIQHDQFIFPQAARGGPGVRQGCVPSKCHDSLKGRPLGALSPHFVVNLRPNLEFPNTGLEKRKDLLERFASQDSRPPHPVNFLGALNGPQALHHCRDSSPADSTPSSSSQGPSLGNRQPVRVESDAFGVAFLQPSPNAQWT